jgi:hypothetical protein
MSYGSPVRPAQLASLIGLACKTGEPFRYPLTRADARREVRRLTELRREQRQRATSERSSVSVAT